MHLRHRSKSHNWLALHLYWSYLGPYIIIIELYRRLRLSLQRGRRSCLRLAYLFTLHAMPCTDARLK